MIQTDVFCQKYTNPMSRCDGYSQGYCRQCFKYDTVDIAVCDNCIRKLMTGKILTNCIIILKQGRTSANHADRKEKNYESVQL